MSIVPLIALAAVLAADPPAMSPTDSLAAITVRPGFKVELIAAEPLVMDPVNLAWGPDGKLWVVEMADYPLGIDGQGQPGGRVRFLEDTDGDGRYDKSTLFADGLSFPTGVMPWRKGVLVTAAPQILYLEDSDGDGKADVKRVLFEGFVEGNQQHRVNGFTWGLDNMIHVANGDSGGELRSAKTGQVLDFRGRDLRFDPDSGAMETTTGQSQFGRVRDDWGNWFGCNNSNPIIHFALDDHYLRRNPYATPPRAAISMVGAVRCYPTSKTLPRPNNPQSANHFTSACGIGFYRDELFGEAFAHSWFVCEPVHNLVHRENIEPRGVLFQTGRANDEQETEFLSSRDNWFRPTRVVTGPDGALWVTDMYRQIIEHPKWIYVPPDELARLDLRAGRDKGRIYRVYREDRDVRLIPRLDDLTTTQLVAALDSQNGWQRDMAHQMLIWRHDKAAVAPLVAMAKSGGRPLSRMQALCVLDGIDAIDEPTLAAALSDADPGVRRHAVRLTDRFAGNRSALIAALRDMALRETDPQVLMQVLYTLGEWRDEAIGPVLGTLARTHADDPYHSAAAISSAPGHLGAMLLYVSGGGEHSAGLIAELARLVAAHKDPNLAATAVMQLVREQGDASAPTSPALLSALGSLLDALAAQRLDVYDISERLDDAAAFKAGVSAMHTRATRLAMQTDADVADRAAAVALVGRDPATKVESVKLLVNMLTPATPIELQRAAVASLARLGSTQVATKLIERWDDLSPTIKEAVLDEMLARASWTRTFLFTAIGRPELRRSLDAARWQALTNHPVPEIRQIAARLLSREVTTNRAAVITKFEPATRLSGDSARGRTVFEKRCATCHKLDGVGKEVGADLTGMPDKSPMALLVAILDPNRAVEDRFLQYVATTRDARTLTGIIAQETTGSVTLLTVDGQTHALARDEIESLRNTRLSLMPQGLEAELDAQGMADLIAFVSTAADPVKRFEGNTPRRIDQAADGTVTLPAAAAELHGPNIIFEQQYRNIGWWSHADAYVAWTVNVTRGGSFDVALDWALHNDQVGDRFVLTIGDQRVAAVVPGTGTWDDYKHRTFGRIKLEPRQYRLTFRSDGPIRKGALIDLRTVVLTPAK